MKLELKYLAPFGNVGCEYQSREGTIIPFDFEDLYDIQEAIKNEVFDPGNYKLLLHPLSDLEKEIEHNREKFVPIVELAKISFPRCSNHDLTGDYVDMGLCYTFHFDKKEPTFDCRRSFDGKKWDSNCFVPNQLQLFQKLFEWHFNVFDLQEELWVDINTVKL